MGTKDNPGSYDCYAKAAPDEPMFILLARDPAAPVLVRLWAELFGSLISNRPHSPSADWKKIEEAEAVAKDMEKWRQGHSQLDPKLEMEVSLGKIRAYALEHRLRPRDIEIMFEAGMAAKAALGRGELVR